MQASGEEVEAKAATTDLDLGLSSSYLKTSWRAGSHFHIHEKGADALRNAMTDSFGPERTWMRKAPLLDSP